jgi:hypothetical protein
MSCADASLGCGNWLENKLTDWDENDMTQKLQFAPDVKKTPVSGEPGVKFQPS